jgi:hypothetical protein
VKGLLRNGSTSEKPFQSFGVVVLREFRWQCVDGGSTTAQLMRLAGVRYIGIRISEKKQLLLADRNA